MNLTNLMVAGPWILRFGSAFLTQLVFFVLAETVVLFICMALLCSDQIPTDLAMHYPKDLPLTLLYAFVLVIFTVVFAFQLHFLTLAVYLMPIVLLIFGVFRSKKLDEAAGARYARKFGMLSGIGFGALAGLAFEIVQAELGCPMMFGKYGPAVGL